MPRFYQETRVELIKIRKNFQVTIPLSLRRLIHLAEGDLVEAEVERRRPGIPSGEISASRPGVFLYQGMAGQRG